MSWDRWIRGVEVEPSIYAGDFSRLGEQLGALLDADARIFHFDIGDGRFIDEITIGLIVLQSISDRVHEYGGVLDCHPMVSQPARHFEHVRAAGGDSVTFHVEAGASRPTRPRLHESSGSAWAWLSTRTHPWSRPRRPPTVRTSCSA